MIFLYLAAALVLVVLGVSLYFFRFACARHVRAKTSIADSPWGPYLDEMHAGRDRFLACNPEQVEIRSRDGLALRGLFYRNGESEKSVLLLHGYRSGGLQDFGVILPFYLDRGYNILLVDQRAHGRSEGDYIAFGSMERYDCADWAAWLDRRLDSTGGIVLDGISMGASTALLACGLPLPASVRGIVADCGYSSPYDQLRHVAQDMMHLPAWPILPLIELWARLLGGFSLRVSAADALRQNTSLPVLFVHGEADAFVPCAASRENYDACAAPKELVLVPDAGHGLSYLVDRATCAHKLQQFLEKLVT